jgi:hypothetical protein
MSQAKDDMWLVECNRCGRAKAPRGCVPVDATTTDDYCTRSCPGYDQWPYPSAPPPSVAKASS